jgi:hypothetical protein
MRIRLHRLMRSLRGVFCRDGWMNGLLLFFAGLDFVSACRHYGPFHVVVFKKDGGGYPCAQFKIDAHSVWSSS